MTAVKVVSLPHGHQLKFFEKSFTVDGQVVFLGGDNWRQQLELVIGNLIVDCVHTAREDAKRRVREALGIYRT